MFLTFDPYKSLEQGMTDYFTKHKEIVPKHDCKFVI